MKNVLLTFLFFAAVCRADANAIDKLVTMSDVNTFLYKKVYKYHDELYTLDDKNIDGNEYGKNKFYKIDLNQDGRTDLIVYGKKFIAVIDKGDNTYDPQYIGGSFTRYELRNIIRKDSVPMIVIQAVSKEYDDDTASAHLHRYDTLVHKFDNLVEYNANPTALSIDIVTYQTSGCFGDCPSFNIRINSNRTADYDALSYNDVSGKYTTVIDINAYRMLVELINYIHLPSLKDAYSVNWTDDQGAELKVQYTNGQIKQLSDYGMIGTFGLEALYNYFNRLRTNQDWRPD